MKQKKVFLMCGPSGSGKTTWVKKQIEGAQFPTAHISRDVIRFSMLKEGEDYFAHEDEVIKEFYHQAQEAIDGEPQAIFIDATHLSEKARNSTLDALNLENCELYAVDFQVPVEICLQQNAGRTGRAKVPSSVIRRMYYSYQAPKAEGEAYKYTILTVGMREEEEHAE